MSTLDDFELIPADDPDLDATVALDAAAASVLGDIEPAAEDAPEPYGMTWIFDFELGRFVRSGSSPAEARGLLALEQWLLMMLHTARYAHPVFSDAFGVEDPSLGIGETRVAEMLDDWETQIREGALVHDRVAEVTEFEAAYDPTQGVLTIINFSVVTDDDETVTIADLQITTGAR
jgi:hypothetical protein